MTKEMIITIVVGVIQIILVIWQIIITLKQNKITREMNKIKTILSTKNISTKDQSGGTNFIS